MNKLSMSSLSLLTHDRLNKNNAIKNGPSCATQRTRISLPVFFPISSEIVAPSSPRTACEELDDK
jgi:hypothetical protein